MSTVSIPIPQYHRPKRAPKVLRKWATIIRMLSFLAVVTVVALLVAWRNFTIQQLTIDVARQRSQIVTLDQELQHLTGSIDRAAPYDVVSGWALEKHGWKLRAGHSDTVWVATPYNSVSNLPNHGTSTLSK